ncbi:ankyrin repeat domain-containing protein 27-like isoform X6 [Salvia splendens]|uniref:ankyrin repeat domain-containing protein 27-like isoform X6 n=1 Tax=Salvia splendens TaxID=180675 RepID=UPI001C274696|nr:ankyrin repeat domain-containing protein 27-like isoform X6 [Salvia splendens]
MSSTSEIGAAIIEAGANGDLNQLWAIRKKVGDELEFRKICDEYSDFSTGRNVLHHAAEIGHLEICKFLIRTVKVYIDALTYKRDTPLAEAVRGGHIKIVEFLIKQGAKDSLPNTEGLTAMHYALLKDDRKVVDKLLLEGTFIDNDSAEGSPLQIAASRGNVQAVRALLALGADPSFYYEFADTPLVCAVKSRSFECLHLLLKDIYKPIEEAAMVYNRAAMEILFPVTERLAHYPNWTVDGIIEYSHSEEFKTMSGEKLSMRLTKLELRGMQHASNKDYYRAILKYRKASHLDPSNPKWISKRSLWEAHMGVGNYALSDVLKWIKLKPDVPGPIPVPNPEGEVAEAAADVIFKALPSRWILTRRKHAAYLELLCMITLPCCLRLAAPKRFWSYRNFPNFFRVYNIES